MPDGAADAASVTGVTIQEDNGKPVVIVKSANGLTYEVKN